MNIVVCASGPVNEIELVQADYYIGVDRGALTLLSLGIVADEMVGDFDSVTEQQFAQLATQIKKVERVSPIKDETDTDLALAKAVIRQPKTIYVTGVTGARLDHQEAAMRSVRRFQEQHPTIQFVIMNKHNTIRFLTPGQHALVKDAYKYVSFFAADETIQAVTLTGVKYETEAVALPHDCTLFTSNEIIADDASITISNGICLMIKSND